MLLVLLSVLSLFTTFQLAFCDYDSYLLHDVHATKER